MIETPQLSGKAPARRLVVVGGLAWIALVIPYGLMAVLSTGSGWSYPNLLPDRVDFSPWSHAAADRDGMLRAAGTSLAMCLAVSLPSTCGGLLAGRAIRRRSSGRGVWMFAAYLPFVLSPVVVAVCLYDLMVRLRLASTVAGVIVCQSLFAFGYATVLFCELWSPRIERCERLVATLGGGAWAVWRHGVLPQASGLIAVCLIQTALWSWLDYGLVSLVGGGRVKSLTVLLFAYIREASVNQAALSALVLLMPAAIGFLTTCAILMTRAKRSSASVADTAGAGEPHIDARTLTEPDISRETATHSSEASS